MKHSEELRRQVVAEYKAGASTWELAKRYQVARSTIDRWCRPQPPAGPRVASQKKRDAPSDVAAPEPMAVIPAEGIDLDELAWRIVNATVASLANIAGITGDADWLKGQNARDLAVLYGVQADKLYRLISSVRTVGDDVEPEQAAPPDVPAGEPPEAAGG